MKKVLLIVALLTLVFASSVFAQGLAAVPDQKMVTGPPAPPAINSIVGSVYNKDFHWPLPSDGWFGTRLTLHRYDQQGYRSYVMSTDCGQYRGCVDTYGYYSIYSDYEGNGLKDGKYVLEIVSKAHLIARVELELWGQQVQINGEMTIIPVYAEVLSSNPTVDRNGGKATARIRVYNFTSKDGLVSANTMVHGPGKVSEYAVYQVSAKLPLTEPWTYGDYDISFEIAADLPNGATYCGNTRIAHRDRADEQYVDLWFCAAKGVEPYSYIQ